MTTEYENEKKRFTERYLSRDTKDQQGGRTEEIRMTPLCSLAVAHTATQSVLPQYGLLGFHAGQSEEISEKEPILLNINAPNSTFICGSQGSGKSYTLSAMLEDCVQKNKSLNKLKEPLAGVVFHYDNDSHTVAEAAHLCSLGIKVRVLVSKSSAATNLKQRYLTVSGAAKNLTVEDFVLQDRHLNVERMLKMMAFDESEGTVPLYMEVIQRILRETAITGQQFSFQKFMWDLKQERFSPGQEAMMNMRLNLLQSFMPKFATELGKDLFNIAPGTLTIVDFSDPLIDQSSACVLFDTCLALFKENRPKSGLVVALDEAHKFLNKGAAAANFTERLLQTIREQRHNATRVIIATQEPTISETSTSVGLPLSTASHPLHVTGAGDRNEVFSRIVDLNVGESLVFSPSSFVGLEGEERKPKKLGSGILKMKTRLREGIDGGRSIMAAGAGEGKKDEDPTPVPMCDTGLTESF
ncbi:hypothetical protein M409DRAFT_27280 [Zasmidium cellare ATCC 36951]|uniref:AAA+ ATPase domain-containing protein n=1 Tax=Zasmidium cellare ATCC 36951 TaxID=1080233 RepID=A0A6A6C532_ZASCE|nr:uncharacterized protein M409DRAFT_27280 [Zasmidium cellare ATCC 36951]KAF2162277.1 hypothetical protein M409DRAFT_27280 [Zasmidium cellare ATCC 36951]